MSTLETAVAATSRESDPGAYFTVDGDSLVPGPMAKGPWGQTLSGHIVGGVLARAIESAVADPALQPARFTVDLPRPVLMEPIQVHTTVARELRPLVAGEVVTPFLRAAMASEVTSSVTHWGTAGLRYINADYTLTLSRLPVGDAIGLAATGQFSSAGVATGTATIFDERGPIGTGVAVALGQPAGAFKPPKLKF